MLFNVTHVATSAVALATILGGYPIVAAQVENPSVTFSAVDELQASSLSPRADVGNSVELRIFPLGDSITNGYQSTDNNGHRLPLQRNLAGSKVLFVGSKYSGTMDDNWNEGWNGFTIDQIAQKAKLSQLYLRPNIVLLHAGTNDLNLSPPIDPDHAPERLGALIDQLVADGPDAVILVAQIINAANAQTESLIQKYNDAIPGVVAQRAKNHKVAVVEKMADIWLQAIKDAADKGWIKAPEGPEPDLGTQGGHSDSHCLTPPYWVPALSNNPIATGVGHNGDMKFTANWFHVLDAASGIGKVGAGVVFADLNGDGLADYLFVNRTTGSVILYLNTGVGDVISWAPANDGKEIASGLAPRDLVRFVDIDLDEKDDYCVIGNDTGSMTVWLNRGSKAGGWNWDGPHEVAPGALGARGINVFFADINGRPDYLLKNSQGGIDAYLNIGKPNTIDGIQWIGAGHIAAGLGTDDISVADINGDGRADCLIWSQTGGLTGYLNYRTEKEGRPGWASTGAMGSIAGGLGKSSAYCHLADLNGDGKADYAIIGDKGEVDLYLNKGSADASVIGDGVRLADLNGDGIDDYIWLASSAAVTLYIDGGQQSDGKHWIWVPANGSKEIANGAGAKREQIIFADMDGDGKEDFVVVDPKSGGLFLYMNNGQQPDGSWGWAPYGPIATCIGGPGSGVRLADMDDYMLLDPNGATTLYLNGGPKPGGWNWGAANNGNAIATGIGFTREHVQFKDIDGDGKADYIGVDQLSGATTVYKNLGSKSDGWGWDPMNGGKLIASGIGSVGADVLWGRLEKTNRYSYVGVSPNTGALRAYLNGCNDLSPSTGASGGSGGTGSSTGGGSGTGIGASNSGSSGSGSGSGSGNSGSGSSDSGSGSSGGSGNGSGNGSGPGSGNGFGSGSNNGNALGVYIDGGLPIPLGGLGGLGLATIGIPALAALTPYAITAQNDLTTAFEAVNTLTAGTPTSAGVAAAVAALTAAASDLNAVSAQASSIDTTSFDSSTADSIQQEQAALHSASQAVADLWGLWCISDREDLVLNAAAVETEKAAHQALEARAGLDLEGLAGRGGGFKPLGGGLPFPSGGLGGLGLPTGGAAAVNALKPYAVTTENALGAALNLLSGLSAGSAPADYAAAADALAGAASDYSALSAQAEAFELISFTETQVAEIQAEQAALRTASENLAQLLPKLRGCIVNPGPCQTIVASGIGLVSASNILGPLVYFSSFNGFGTKATQSSNPASPTAAATSTASPTQWLLNTKSGTSIEVFKALIATLPDKGAGKQIAYEGLSSQWYTARMTREEALIVHGLPIVDQLVPNRPLDMRFDFVPENTTEHQLLPRDEVPIIATKPGAPRFLRQLSTPRNQRVADLDENDINTACMFEESQGKDSFIYIFDVPIRWGHSSIEEFAGKRQTTYFPLGLYDMENGLGPTYLSVRAHGTAVASVAAGNTLGVAKRATIINVVVAARNDDREDPNLPDVIADAWTWAIKDVQRNNRQGKAVFSISNGLLYEPEFKQAVPPDPEYSQWRIPFPANDDFFLPLIVEAWENDIPTVFANSNNKRENIGTVTPQHYGSAKNPLITVGSLSPDGFIWNNAMKLNGPGSGDAPEGPDSTLGLDPQCTGYRDLFAFSVNMMVADGTTENGFRPGGGGSLAAPQVSALIAYFMSLPPPHTLPMPRGQVAYAAKAAVVNLRRQLGIGSPDGIGAAYNGIREILCTPVQVKPRSDEGSLNATAAALAGAELELRMKDLDLDGSLRRKMRWILRVFRGVWGMK